MDMMNYYMPKPSVLEIRFTRDIFEEKNLKAKKQASSYLTM